MELTHINENGEVNMVDVGAKEKTGREAVAQSKIRMKPETLAKILEGNIKKGDVFAAARIAAIMAAKRTSELIPLCHPIAVTYADAVIDTQGNDTVTVTATVRCVGETGVEMEALTAASIGALTVYDMCKAIDRGMTVQSTRLLKKSGGKSGVYLRGPGEVCGTCLTPQKEMSKQLSLLSKYALDEMEKMDYSGLCMEKFHANLIVDGLDFKALKSGDIIAVGKSRIELTSVGKRCFEDCPLVQSGIDCPLKNECAFAVVIQSGEIFDGCPVQREE
ncbi:MAG: cyclic pyranopterin monophosphate synthase MoaC [Oscillospiraceae bacterium]